MLRTADAGQAQADDEAVLRFAEETNRILITIDAHFGDWVFLPLRRHPGVVRLKVHPPTTENLAAILCPFLDSRRDEELQDQLVIISPRSERWVTTA